MIKVYRNMDNNAGTSPPPPPPHTWMANTTLLTIELPVEFSNIFLVVNNILLCLMVWLSIKKMCVS